MSGGRLSDLNPLKQTFGFEGNTDGVPGAVDIEVVDQFSDKNWRLANLYYIQNEYGVKVPFTPNEAQADFFSNMWYLNVNLKARQLGFTTAWCIWMLDECLFYPDQSAGVIAHNLDDAKKIFRTKIEYPYDNLPEGIKALRSCDKDRAEELVFSNKSSISVGTSMRSGTLQYLLVSEFGKICAKYPEKANEIVSGSFNTVHDGSYVTVESTAEGRQGHFWEMCKKAQALQLENRTLTRLDWKFHFYAWFWKEEYHLSDEDTKHVVITAKMQEYFTRLEDKGIFLSPNQKAWYVKKRETLGDLMMREHPSTWEEAFEQSTRGAYFMEQVMKARADKRFTRVPHEEGVAVDTYWDLGMRDTMALVFTQTIGREIRIIDTYSNSDYGLAHYVKELAKRKEEKGYHYRHHVAPHDIKVRELGTGVSRLETAKSLGINFVPGPHLDFEDQLEAARNIFSICWFDESNCEDLISSLENFRKEWDEARGVYKEKPFHDQNSHYASAFMLIGVMQRSLSSINHRKREVKQAKSGGWT